MRRRHSLRQKALAFCLASAPLSASAGNQEAVLLGNDAAMTGGAVTARVDDAGAAFYNPAGLAQMDRSSVDLSASAFILRLYDLPNAAQTRLPGGVEPRDASFIEIVSVPSALTFVRRLGDGITGSLSIFIPDHEDLIAGSSYEGTDYQWSIAVSRRTTDYYVGPSLGWEMAKNLRLGVSLFGSYHTSRGTRDFRSDYDATGDAGGPRSVLGVESRLLSRSFGARIGLGLQWEPAPRMSLGLVMRSPEALVGIVEELDAGSSATLVLPGSPPLVQTESVHDKPSETTFEAVRPGRVTLAASRSFDRGWVDLEADLEPGLSNPARSVAREAVWNVRVGGQLTMSDHVRLGAGLFTDRSPQREPSALGATRIDFYGLAAGMQLLTTHALKEEENRPEGIALSTTLALRYARGEGEIGGLLFDPLAPPKDIVADVTIHELSLHIGTSLDF